MFKMILKLVPIVLIVAGCAKVPVEESKNENISFGKMLGSKTVFATLKEVDGEYKFINIGSQSGNVILNDLSPREGSSTFVCGPDKYGTIYRKNEKQRWEVDCKESEFRASRIHLGASEATAMVLASVITIGRTAIEGNHRRESYFDAEKFEKAVNSALENLETPREKIISDYENIVFAAKEKAEILREDYTKMYGEQKSNISFEVVVNDKTGFWDKNQVLNPNDYIRIKENYLDRFVEPGLGGNPEQWDAYIAGISKGLADYEVKLKEQIATYSVELKKDISLDGFEGSFIVPNEIRYPSDEKYKAVALINRKNFWKKYPVISGSDENMSIYFNGKKIEIKNKTNNYIAVYDISVYHGNKINTTNYDRLNFPPKSVEYLHIDELAGSIIADEATISGITKKQAIGTDFYFGFAVKYLITNTNIEKTLFFTKKQNLYELLALQ